MVPFRSWNLKEKEREREGRFLRFVVHIVYDVSIPIVNVYVYGTVFVAYIRMDVCNCNPFGIKSTINNNNKNSITR